jgi:hypothetical protein
VYLPEVPGPVIILAYLVVDRLCARTHTKAAAGEDRYLLYYCSGEREEREERRERARERERASESERASERKRERERERAEAEEETLVAAVRCVSSI